MQRVAVGLAWLIAALALSASTPAAAADPYPTRPIRLVVGFLAGGPTDIPARFIADRLKVRLGQPVLVENRPGAGGMIALNEVLAQPRDGYSLQVCTYFDALNTVLYKKVAYKLSDIAPVTLISKYYYLLALSTNLPVNNFGEFIAYVKAHPGEVLYGQVGAGSSQELVAHELEKSVGIKMTGVPFKGSNQIAQEMVAGRIHFQVGPPIAITPFYQSHQLKVLAVTSPERLKTLPEVPTLTELGFPLTPYAWLGICAGAGTPKPVIELLNKNFVSIIESDEYRAFMEKTGNIPVSSTPEEFGRVLVETVDHAAPYIKEFHMQIE